MATTSAQAESGLDDISRRIVNARANLDQCKALAAQVEQELTNLNTQYTGLVTDINAKASAPPAGEATYWTNVKARKDVLVPEFTALKTQATNMKNATAAITY